MDKTRRQRFKTRKNNYSESKSKLHDHAENNAMKQESNSKKSKVILKLLLPEDLIIDILSRVSLKCLLNSARYVCKSWATIIGSSNFAEVYRQCARSKPGLLVENTMSEKSHYFLDIKDDLNGHFERVDLGTYPGMGSLMNTCDGVLLFWVGPEQVFVVNPILKCWLRVPPLPTREFLTIGSLSIARVPRSSIFKLFFVDIRTVLGVDWFVFYVLKVGIDNSWKAVAVRQKVPNEHYFFKQPLYSGGNDLYWILEEGVIAMDVDKEIIVKEYPLPPLRDHYLGVDYFWMGNHLSCIVHENPTTKAFQVYILDINSGKWSLYHEMGLFHNVVAYGLKVDDIILVRVRFWMNEQIIFKVAFHQDEMLNTGFKRIHFGYNVKTRQLTKIEGIPEGCDVWLHTNSLASFPSTS